MGLIGEFPAVRMPFKGELLERLAGFPGAASDFGRGRAGIGAGVAFRGGEGNASLLSINMPKKCGTRKRSNPHRRGRK